MPLKAAWWPTDVRLMTRDGRCRLQAVEQQAGQVEVRQVADAHGVLEALRRLLALRPGPAGVVVEDVEAVPAGQDVVGRLAHRGQVGQVERDDVDVVVPGPPVTSWAAASALAWLRQASTVVAPWAATPTAVSRPTPVLAPVMTTTLPCMLMSVRSLEVLATSLSRRPGAVAPAPGGPLAGASGPMATPGPKRSATVRWTARPTVRRRGPVAPGRRASRRRRVPPCRTR